LFEQLA